MVDSLAKNIPIVPEISAQFVFPSPKFWDFQKKLSLGVFSKSPNVSTAPINVYLLVLSSWKVNIVENPITVMGL